MLLGALRAAICPTQARDAAMQAMLLRQIDHRCQDELDKLIITLNEIDQLTEGKAMPWWVLELSGGCSGHPFLTFSTSSPSDLGTSHLLLWLLVACGGVFMRDHLLLALVLVFWLI